jgi:hypothetical protein
MKIGDVRLDSADERGFTTMKSSITIVIAREGREIWIDGVCTGDERERERER